MGDDASILVGFGGGQQQRLNLRRANRHGLIAGATGTGKTVTLQGLAEGFSRAGVPVFLTDVKGDLAGMAMPGSPTSGLHQTFAARSAEIGESDWRYEACPVHFWDLFGQQGHCVRTTVSEMGPLLLGRLLDLNATQQGVLSIVFHVADEEGLLLLDLDDLQAMLADCAARASELTTRYGNISRQSAGAIQRAILQLRSQGGDHFFGEPALDVMDLLKTDDAGRGVVNILAADRLMSSPALYSTFLLWLLSELFETLPEVGDPDKPKLVFFFDEAHLLFDDAPEALLDKIEQVVRLIRSKGVGIYFVTQNPADIPDRTAGQLGNRIQHALRAYTPRDQQAVKAAATTFRPNPLVNVETAITELKVGEALVSLLQEDGSPSPVERSLIKAPRSRAGPLTDEERRTILATDDIGDRYDTPVNRESAAEILAARVEADPDATSGTVGKVDGAEPSARRGRAAPAARRTSRASTSTRADPPGLTDKMIQSAARSAASSIGRQIANAVGRQLTRGILGGLFKSR